MRKSIKSKSKRKWIVGGFAFFGGIALLTTGFAAWVFGVNQNLSGSGVHLGSDTAINDTVFLDVKTGADDKLVLAESEAHPNKAAGEIAATQDNKDGLITFDATGMQVDIAYTVVWGKDKALPQAINLSLPTTAGKEELPEGIVLADKYANDSISTIAKNVKYEASTRTGKTYFEAPDKIDIKTPAQQQVTQNPNASSYTLEGTAKVTFKWGSFFEGKSPLNYYNGLSKALHTKIGQGGYDAKQYLNDASTLSQQATEELNAMHSLFNGKQVYLLAKLEQAAA